MAESNTVTQRMSELINEGHPSKAYQLASTVQPESDEARDAHYWLHVALAALLCGQSEDVVDEAMSSARLCNNYSSIMEGDFHRDSALSGIKRLSRITNRAEREQLVESIYTELDHALAMHANDPNRLAAINMVYGRLDYALGLYEEAYWQHCVAHLKWQRLQRDGEAVDEQWILNNRFHRIRANVMQSHRSWLCSAADCIAVILHDKSREHRRSALHAFVEGARGNRMLEDQAA